MSHHAKPRTAQARRQGSTMIVILIMAAVLFAFLAFSVDIARVQLAQLELQSASDLASRAGADALARGVGDPNNIASVEAAVRNEVAMVIGQNTIGGDDVQLQASSQIEFGQALTQQNGDVNFQSTGGMNNVTNALRVSPDISQFPVLFGNFVNTNSLSFGTSAAAAVQERDIVVVLDRSCSMADHDAGTMALADYPANLGLIEDQMYATGDFFHPDTPNGGATAFRHTEFDVNSGIITQLSRMQALKLAMLRFRQEIDNTRGIEQLGLVAYSMEADDPAQGRLTGSPCDIVAGLTAGQQSTIIGNGISLSTVGGSVVAAPSERFASHLESEDTNYRNFDFNYIGMRFSERTNIAAGITKGAELLLGPNRRSHATPIMLVMTDGMHNQASTPEIAASAAMATNPDLRIFSITFGAGAATAPMQNVAAIGNGTHHHANDVNDLVDVFVELANTAGVMLIE